MITRSNIKLRTGFTLIELVVTMTIISVLAAIAYPGYLKYSTQTRRSDAYIAINQVSALLEKYNTQCNTYTTQPGNNTPPPITNLAPYCPGQQNAGLGMPLTNGNMYSQNKNYVITITAGTIAGLNGGSCTNINCGFIVTADPTVAGTTGLQANDGRLRMDSTGVKQWDKNNNLTWSYQNWP
ncbi:MAG: type IV pilin protein [Sulfuricaulis sp.]